MRMGFLAATAALLLAAQGAAATVTTCAGDCDGNGKVTIEEPVRLVGIALGELPLVDCEAGDADQDGQVRVAEIVTSVGNAAVGCPGDSDNPLDGIGTLELVQDGFVFLEGPRWSSEENVLFFSDVQGDTIYRLTPPDSVEIFRTPSNQANGLDFDGDHNLIAAEHATRRISRTDADGNVTTVVDRFEGARLNSPNDVTVRSDGAIYFTDPPFATPPGERELSFNGVFRIAADGTLFAESRGGPTSLPNGIELSPDESLIYVMDSFGTVFVWDVAASGALSNERIFAAPVPAADGSAIDRDGNLYVASSVGVQVFAPDGRLWGTIEVPAPPSNCAFAGADFRTLYITARSGLYRIAVVIPGIP